MSATPSILAYLLIKSIKIGGILSWLMFVNLLKELVLVHTNLT